MTLSKKSYVDLFHFPFHVYNNMKQINKICNKFILVGDAYEYCYYVALHTRATLNDIQQIYSFCHINNVSKEWLVENLGNHLNKGKSFRQFSICDVPISAIIGD